MIPRVEQSTEHPPETFVLIDLIKYTQSISLSGFTVDSSDLVNQCTRSALIKYADCNLSTLPFKFLHHYF